MASTKKITDRSILDFSVQFYDDVMSDQQARIWYGIFVLQWDNKRIAKALQIDTKTVRAYTYEVRKIIAADPKIAYRSIEGIS